jgi:hypothetical protein
MAVPQEAPLAPFFLPTVATASTLAFVAPSTTVTAGDVAAAAAASTTTHLPAWSDDSEEEDGVCVCWRGCCACCGKGGRVFVSAASVFVWLAVVAVTVVVLF